LPIKEAKKALRGIVIGRELLQRIQKAMQDKDQATLIEILAQTKDKPPRDAETAKQLDLCRQRVATNLRDVRRRQHVHASTFELAVKLTDVCLLLPFGFFRRSNRR
jgi:hypothetical protein